MKNLFYLQFASDGLWEEALRLEPPFDASILQDWLNKKATDDIALELFMGEAEFVGLRLKPFKHETLLMQWLEAPSIESLREILNVPELFQQKPDFAELGVVNAWKSLGALKIWQRGEAIPSLEALAEKFNPLWIRPKPIALEFASLQPLPHWRAVPVSIQKDDGYHLNLQSLHQALSRQTSVE